MRRKKEKIMGIVGESGAELDRNDCFIRRFCISCLIRYLEGRPRLDLETLVMACELLAENSIILAAYLVDSAGKAMSKRDRRKFFDVLVDPNRLASRLLELLENGNPFHVSEFSAKAVELLGKRHESLAAAARSDIERNMAAFRKTFDLSDSEAALCLFLFVLRVWRPANTFFEDHLECNRYVGRKHLTRMLSMTDREIGSALTGTLARIEAIDIDYHDRLELEIPFVLLLETSSSKGITGKYYFRVKGPCMPLDNFILDGKKVRHVLKILGTRRRTATHVLFYGPPGTGKSSLARALSQKTGFPAYEIARDNDNKTSLRRAAITACVNMTGGGRGSIIIVDEADNLLNTQMAWLLRGETQDKGWLNGLLELPGTRMIWITNAIDHIEQSVLRRFAFSIPFRPFNRSQRALLWENIASRNRVKRFFLRGDFMRCAKRYRVSAGAIDLAVKKAAEPRPRSRREFHEAVALAIEAHMTLMQGGHQPVDRDGIDRSFSLEGLNAGGGLEPMLQRLSRFDQYLRHGRRDETISMNLLFHGPPGTGKSELARFVADKLDRELICRRGSDILDPYVGVAEKNVRLAFEEAEAAEAVLVIDEADALLYSRGAAVRSWEVSLTSELLTWMERFRGILICTTNRLEGLDEASLRRFNHKIAFKYLAPAGNVIFYEKMLQPLLEARIEPALRQSLEAIRNLAPGDFRVVRDRFAFSPPGEATHEALVRALQEEAAVKASQAGNRITGFRI
ncbi:MAG: AAA family ATPase [Pseudomonadota bacterium]